MLGQETAKYKSKPAEDKKLFTFASEPDWKEKLEPFTMDRVKMIVSAYHAADARIRYIKHLSTDFKRQKDVTAFYYANKHDDLDWVILPIANFNAYYRATTFEKNYLPALPKNVFIRETLDGLCRFKVVL